MKVKIVYELEISDHDGYCSGNECEYTKECKEYIVEIPDDENIDLLDLHGFNDLYWKDLLPRVNIDTWGSGYCDSSKECYENNMDKHSYRYRIVHILRVA